MGSSWSLITCSAQRNFYFRSSKPEQMVQSKFCSEKRAQADFRTGECGADLFGGERNKIGQQAIAQKAPHEL